MELKLSPVTLNFNQTYRLLKAIEFTKRELFEEINQLGSLPIIAEYDMKRLSISAEYDMQGRYTLTLKRINPILSRMLNVSWDLTDNIHNYILMNGISRL